MHKETHEAAPKAVASTDVPHAAKKEMRLEKHGDVRIDSYYWLKERENPDVVGYLKKENAYYDKFMKPQRGLEDKVFEEMKGRVKEDDSTAPYKDGDYYYYSRYEKGRQYPIFARKFKSLDAKEEIILDANSLARGHNFYSIGSVDVSPDHKILAYSFDTIGRRFYSVAFKDLTTGKNLKDKLDNVTGNLEWANDNKTIFYTQQDPKTLRSDRVFRMTLGEKPTQIYNETDETFSVYVYKTLAQKHIFISSDSTLTSEVRFVSAAQPNEEPKLFLKRKRDHEYGVYDGDDGFYIVTNDKAKNRKLYRTGFDHIQKSKWVEIIPHRKDIYLSSVLVFKDHIAVIERKDGLERMRVLEKKGRKSSSVEFKDPAYTVAFESNAEYASPVLRYVYESPRQPESIFDYDFSKKTSTLVKAKEVPNFNSDLYRVERKWIKARDGQKVPVTMLMKKEAKANGMNPMLVYGYGSYGYSIDPYFSQTVFSLVDRGFIYAVAHIRGGGELGRKWTDDGRTTKKMNTFFDFIDATDALVKEQWADPRRVYAMGGSAGGLLMGAVMNLRPDLYHGMVAHVPFVDVLTTMLDPSIPLTTGEYDEWGDPNTKKFYDYIKKYSPYDNVGAKAYPNLLVTTGFHDSQVQYWEPAKWVARLRELKTNDPVILLKTNLEAGHGGKTGRFDRLREIAEHYTFILAIDHDVPSTPTLRTSKR